MFFSEAAGRSLIAIIAKMHLLRNSGFQSFTKMYHNCVAPISDYFAGILGFNHFDSSNKIQNRACCYYLGLHPKTPITGLQDAMGWLLPKYRHIIALFRTWNRLTKLKTDWIVSKVLKWDNKMFNGWSKQFRDICDTLGCVQPCLGEVYDLELNKKIVQSKCQEDWLKNVSMKPKLRSYVMLKNIFKSERFVKMAHSKMSCSIFPQLRLGILPLEIETGRFQNISSESRMCHFCKNEIEDELHFVCVFPVYSNHRKILFQLTIISLI